MGNTTESKLETFLVELSPEKTIDKAKAAADRALNSFSIRHAQITNWDDFKKIIADFYCLVECNIIGLEEKRPTNLFMDWGLCSNLFFKKYGRGGDRTAFNIARSGVEEGVYGVLKSIADSLAEQYINNWIRGRIGDFWNSLSVAEKLSVPLEYLEKYKHIIPPEILEKNPNIFVYNFYEFLPHHPQLMINVRNIR